MSAVSRTEARYRVPEHVVHRSFPAETVVLNLETGRYHGLNPTAGRMLETLDRLGSMEETAVVLAGEYGQPLDTVLTDLAALCSDLIERGLIQRA
jgi:hypothetical protein